MLSGEVRKVTRQDLQLVQNLIEQCLQLHMNQKEVVDTLLLQAKIEPSFTELVWQKLEQENQEFFKAYHVRLVVKNQIMMFNQLLEKQAQLMHEVRSAGAPLSFSSGSTTSSKHQLQLQYAHLPVLPSSVVNDGDSSHHDIQLANGSSIICGMNDTSPGSLTVHNEKMPLGVKQEICGTPKKLEPGFLNDSEFLFCTDGGFLQEHPSMGDPPDPSGEGTGLNGSPINECIPDTMDPTSLGYVNQFPRTLSFMDFTDHDILENYSKSPLIHPVPTEFSGSSVEELEGKYRRPDIISEGYDGLASKKNKGLMGYLCSL